MKPVINYDTLFECRVCGWKGDRTEIHISGDNWKCPECRFMDSFNEEQRLD